MDNNELPDEFSQHYIEDGDNVCSWESEAAIKACYVPRVKPVPPPPLEQNYWAIKVRTEEERRQWEEEDNARQDAYLSKYGI